MNSRSWGNYSNSVGGAATDSGDLQISGTSEYWKVNNIYDLAGNVWEYTQENHSQNSTGHVGRGDCYSSIADTFSAASRNGISSENGAIYNVRIQNQFLFIALYTGSDNLAIYVLLESN